MTVDIGVGSFQPASILFVNLMPKVLAGTKITTKTVPKNRFSSKNYLLEKLKDQLSQSHTGITKII